MFPPFGINFALFKLCCYSYLFSCVDVALWLVEVLRAVRAHFFVRDKAMLAISQPLLKLTFQMIFLHPVAQGFPGGAEHARRAGDVRVVAV